jgi:predicted nucleotidyltransferase
MSLKIALDETALADFCQRHHIRRLAFFGSVLRDDFGPASDVDVLVDFDPAHIPGFFGLGQMQDELSHLLSERRVDLVTAKFLNHRMQKKVLETAQVAYASG